MTQTQQDDGRVEVARDMLRDAQLGTVFEIGFRQFNPALWILIKNDRYEFTIMNLESGDVVTSKINLFVDMVGQSRDGFSLRFWE